MKMQIKTIKTNYNNKIQIIKTIKLEKVLKNRVQTSNLINLKSYVTNMVKN